MSLVVCGLSHRTAPIDLLDRAAVPEEQLPKALAGLVASPHVVEAMVLSTCNRVEVYAQVSRYHAGVAALREHFAQWTGLPPEEVNDHLVERHDDAAVAHLLGVTAGLEAMVLGERQIQLQVKQALAAAEREGAARGMLSRLVHHALRVGKRVRAETDLVHAARSMVDLGLETAAEHAGGLADRTVLVVGAGKMGRLAADRIAASSGHVLVANRSPQRRERLAERVAGEPIALTEAQAALERADVVITSTGAADTVLDHEDVVAAQARREGRPLILLDLAVPRDVDPSIREIPGVTLLDVTDLAGREHVSAEAAQAGRAIVEEETEAFQAWTRSQRVAPAIASLRRHAEDVRAAEVARLSGRLGGLDERERETVEALTKGIVNTLLHEPTVRLKDLADGSAAELHVEVLNELFGLPGEPGDADAPGDDADAPRDQGDADDPRDHDQGR